MACGSFRVKG
ncbi:hypothetical protein XELAEV_180177342mg, partial [Xenopus laevis]